MYCNFPYDLLTSSDSSYYVHLEFTASTTVDSFLQGALLNPLLLFVFYSSFVHVVLSCSSVA
jgi:hypothetical protein